MSDNKDVKGKENNYYTAKAEQYKGRKRPSKLHEMNLIAYIENEDGTLSPVYREEQ